ncbi:MAG: hypothetical protein KDD53_00980 [Bdellovibrionales bacterium]|nr:hypothetical protein [Bdellovibrionales bacterium]
MNEILSAIKDSLREIYQTKELSSIEYKGDGTLVTALDLKCHSIISARLKSLLPIVSEEDPSTHSLIDSCDDYILIDPIDGTSACKRFFGEIGGQVGFGPLVGRVRNGNVIEAFYGNVMQRALYHAKLGEGVRKASIYLSNTNEIVCEEWNQLIKPQDKPLRECALLFYASSGEEMLTVRSLREKGKIETAYRFGGFANDCVRLAEGKEELLLQYKASAWDATATLFASEAGFEVLFDPKGSRARFMDWSIKQNNPVLIAPVELIDELIQELI